MCDDESLILDHTARYLSGVAEDAYVTPADVREAVGGSGSTIVLKAPSTTDMLVGDPGDRAEGDGAFKIHVDAAGAGQVEALLLCDRGEWAEEVCGVDEGLAICLSPPGVRTGSDHSLREHEGVGHLF